jgi:hypothetical protein
VDLLHKFEKEKEKKKKKKEQEKPYLRVVACYYGGGVFVRG